MLPLPPFNEFINSFVHDMLFVQPPAFVNLNTVHMVKKLYIFGGEFFRFVELVVDSRL